MSVYLFLWLTLLKYVCLYVCMNVYMFASVYACMFVCMFTRVYVCMYACLQMCMYACLQVCMSMYVCMCMYVDASLYKLRSWSTVSSMHSWGSGRGKGENLGHSYLTCAAPAGNCTQTWSRLPPPPSPQGRVHLARNPSRVHRQLSYRRSVIVG